MRLSGEKSQRVRNVKVGIPRIHKQCCTQGLYIKYKPRLPAYTERGSDLTPNYIMFVQFVTFFCTGRSFLSDPAFPAIKTALLRLRKKDKFW